MSDALTDTDPPDLLTQAPDDWTFEVDPALGGRDEAIEARLREAGFTAEQAKLVYDLAAEHLAPLMTDAASEIEVERETERLVRHFGGRDAWARASGEIARWAHANLPPAAVDALASSADGVLALHGMMRSREPALAGGGSGTAEGLDGLKAMMRDPRYWRDRDPALMARVSEGFRRFYDG